MVIGMRLNLFALVALLASTVSAHPEEFSEQPTGAELARRGHLASKRHLAARNCAPSINAFHATRRAKRSLAEQVPLGNGGQEAIQGYTCVTAPEIEEGPYYVNNELVRQDLIEDQRGVLLRLDIGVIDTATCEPIPDAFIEIWSANATGFYGAFESNSLGPPPGDGPGRQPGDRRPPGGPGGPEGPGGPGGPDGPGGPGGPRGGGPPMSSSNTWLRGGFPTDESGTVELTTIYPGFYQGRTIHVHLMVRTGWEKSENGTLVSHSGSLRHVGQLFFEESWNVKVLANPPYTNNKARRTLNEQDHDFKRATIDRSSAIVQLESLVYNDDDEESLLGFITIGIDTTADYSIHSGNYYNSSADADFESSSVVDVDA